MKRRLYQNTIANFAITILPLIIGLFLTPFIVHHLGNSAFGIWALALTLVGFSGFFDLGLTPTVSKKIAEYIAKDEKEQVNITSSTILVFYCGLGLLALVSFFIIGKFFLTSWFNIPQELEGVARIAVYILGIQALISFPLRWLDGIVQGMQRFAFRALVIGLTAILNAALIVVLLLQGHGLITLVVIGLVTQMIQGCGYFIYIRRALPYLAIRPRQFRWDDAKPLLSFSLQIFVVQICAFLILGTDKVIIGVFLPIAAITMYEIGLRIYNAIRSLVASAFAVVLPAASELDATGNKQGLQELFLRGSKYVLIAYLFLAVPAIMLAHPFITWWMGEEFSLAASILVVLLIGQMFNVLNFVSVAIFLGIGKLKVLTIVRVASAAFNVGISIFLLQIMGIVGVAWGTTIQFFLSDIFLLFYSLSQFGVPLRHYLRECILTTFPFAAIAGAILFLDINLTNVEGIGMIVLAGAIYVLVFGSLVFFLGLNQSERRDTKLVMRGLVNMGKMDNIHRLLVSWRNSRRG